MYSTFPDHFGGNCYQFLKSGGRLRTKAYFQGVFIQAMETALTPANQLQQRINLALRIVLALLFVVSAVAKLYPSPYFAITTFESKQLIPMGFNATFAQYFSRILIGGELALGILLLQRHYFKRLIVPASAALLLVFCIHLTYSIASGDNSGNCGCFGSLLPMTPAQALIKNIIAIGMLAWVFATTDRQTDRLNFPIVLSITLASVLTVFLVGPMRYVPTTTYTSTYDPSLTEDEDEEPATTTSAQLPANDPSKTPATADPKAPAKDSVKVEKVDEPSKKKSGFKQYFADIDKGKKVLCFFAPGCEHCRETAKQLTQMKKQDPNFPDVRIIFMDEEAELIPQFFEFAGATYPHIVMDVGQFWTVAANRDTPGVLYLWNGNLVKDWDGIEGKAFKQAELKKLVSKPWSELK